MADEKKYKEDRGLFDKLETEVKEKKPVASKHKGIVAGINKKQGYIIVDVNGNGERTPYLEERHSKLKLGDPIEF